MLNPLTPLLFFFFFFSLLPFVAANVEKTIFLAPHPSPLPSTDPTLDDLGLNRLSPSAPSLRTHLNASFPTPETPGTDSWFFLENLTPGQRYEVRVCYLATQPTIFTLDTYTLANALDDPTLLASVSRYSAARLEASLLPVRQASNPNSDGARGSAGAGAGADSVLFLRVRAAAEYFSPDEGLMERVPPVLVDVILDPFLGNVFPRSLVGTAVYAGVVALLAVGVAWWVMGVVRGVMEREVGLRDDGKKIR
ncbi:uncharacterized protein ACLA_031850 [Aspergillus clavatus NRRL 1]|uniref:Uncharacterized protein n=1 Tax=Aspergillus clavatus (strain ATCC 1007 / CBS 513.65 / DSM 816 / NCTC 3887 / NRRL 1 / QM 1276 / 107) TaxID=344612 RepID=A1CS29_ASPCL|nr:uncharacterized protein ACLA_031850 [Aspergillus clavatus NRRL 1]EAW08450.1 conserved hypothetical protein [Aspergillus clavatus NRRL 1]